MKYAIAYLRVSTDQQTIENQRVFLQDWAIASGYEIRTFFEDSAVSGTIPAGERFGFRAMLETLQAGRVDAVLVYELSRVGRTFWDTLAAIKLVEKYAPLLSCSPKESFLQTTDPSVRKLLVGILSWVAEREREVMVERIRAGMARAKAEGKKYGRPEKQVDWKRFNELVDQGMPINKIAPQLGVSHMTLYRKLRQVI